MGRRGRGEPVEAERRRRAAQPHVEHPPQPYRQQFVAQYAEQVVLVNLHRLEKLLDLRSGNDALRKIDDEHLDRIIVDRQPKLFRSLDQQPLLHQRLVAGGADVPAGGHVVKRKLDRHRVAFGHHQLAAQALHETDRRLTLPAEGRNLLPVEIAVLGGRGRKAAADLLRLAHRLHDRRKDHEADHHQHAKEGEHQFLVFSEYLEWASHGSTPFCGWGAVVDYHLTSRTASG